MAFTVNFWQITKEVNSTAQPFGSGTAYSCVSNADFNVLAPRLPLQIGAAANPTSYNYCQVPAWGRYYWISRWAFEAGLWVAYCEVDALASWKTQIGSTSAYVLRAAAANDPNIIDNLYPFATDYTYEYDAISPPWDLTPSNNAYIVGIVGSGATQYYAFSKSNLDSFLNYLFSDAYATAALGSLALTLNPDLKVALNPMQYITSIVRIPLSVTVASTINSIKVGLVSVSCDASLAINYSRQLSWTIRRHPNANTRGTWLNAAGSQYTLSLPGFGDIALDPLEIANSTTVRADITVDSNTGHATAQVFASGKFMGRLQAQVGMSYPIGNAVSPGWGLSSAINTFGGAAANIISGRIGAAALGVLGGFNDAAAAEVPKVSSMGGASAEDAFTGMATLYYTWRSPVSDDNTHRGRPLCQVRQLSTLPGYQLCTNTDVSIPATREEIDTIRRYLETGYYYE